MIEGFFQEAYISYKKIEEDVYLSLSKNPVLDLPPFELYSIDDFIKKCMIDSNFSKKYGVNIYKIKLSFEERINLINANDKKNDTLIIAYCENPSDEWLEQQVHCILNKHNTPSIKICLTYKDKSINVYE